MKNIEFPELKLIQELVGRQNVNLDKIATAFDVSINSRGNSILIEGGDANIKLAEKLLKQSYQLLENNFCFTESDFDAAIASIKNDENIQLKELFLSTILKTVKNKAITPRSPVQYKYTQSVLHNDIVFAIGPAGTGKTYLGMAFAVSAFTKGSVKKIILTRPAVEAGEALGFLPGDLAQKIHPYLRPLYDALYDT